MTSPDGSRLTLFVGLRIVSRAAVVSPIALAPGYMFSPMIAGLAVCFRHDI